MNLWPGIALLALALTVFLPRSNAAVATSEIGVACVSCHPAEVNAYRGTHMAAAMAPAAATDFGTHVNGLTLKEAGDDGFRFLYKVGAADIAVLSFRGSEHAEGRIDWVLGAGVQGQTPVVQSSRGFAESRVSYFPGLERYGITVGQDAKASPNAEIALGRPKTNAETAQCFSCHARVRDVQKGDLAPGVQCEQCHAGAERHAVGSGKVISPGKMPARDQVAFCGACHRNEPPVDAKQLENVRFQPLRLSMSKCFASNQLSCMTCHPAHQDAVRHDAAFYNAKCATCHTQNTRHKDARSSTGNCIGCHMPQVQLHPALRFTDHFIRIASLADYPAGSVVQRRE